MTAYGESKGMLHVYHQASLVLVSEEVRCQFLTQLIYTPYPWNGRLGEIPRRSEYSRRGKISFSCRESEGDSQAFNWSVYWRKYAAPEAMRLRINDSVAIVLHILQNFITSEC